MKTTTNFGLKKPDGTDFFNVADQNDNMDKIDTALQEFKDGSTKVGNADKLDGNDSTHFATAASVKAITDGTTKVGNADKLDGKDSSYFATADSVTNIVKGNTKVGDSDKLDGKDSSYFAAANSVYSKTETDNKIQDAIDGLETGDTPIGNASSLDGHRADYFATAQSVTDIVNGNTPVGNASNAAALGSETALQWQGKIDSIQTTSRATLSQAGWYRVAEIPKTHFTTIVDIALGNRFSEGGIGLNVLRYDNRRGFKILSSSYDSNNPFPAIRRVYTDTTIYIEVYYSLAVRNNCEASINTLVTIGSSIDDKKVWKALNFIPTSETVSGVTVTTTYDIPANASPVTDLDIADLVSDTDLTTALAMYLKNSGDVEHSGNIGLVTSGTSAKILKLKNSLREMRFGVSSDGSYSQYDATNGKTIIHSLADGTNTFNGTASGNLPLIGGGKVYKSNGVPVVVEGDTMGFVESRANDRTLGYLGFDADNRPRFMDRDFVSYDLLHTGNSAKVAIQSTAPTDGLWVW